MPMIIECVRFTFVLVLDKESVANTTTKHVQGSSILEGSGGQLFSRNAKPRLRP